MAAVAVAAARQSVPAEVLKRAERARISGMIVAWCQGEFRSGRPGDIAAAVTGAGGRWPIRGAGLGGERDGAGAVQAQARPVLLQPRPCARAQSRPGPLGDDRGPDRAALEHHRDMWLPRRHQRHLLAIFTECSRIRASGQLDHLTAAGGTSISAQEGGGMDAKGPVHQACGRTNTKHHPEPCSLESRKDPTIVRDPEVADGPAAGHDEGRARSLREAERRDGRALRRPCPDHRGQISTYCGRWDSTVPQIYGPSADEP